MSSAAWIRPDAFDGSSASFAEHAYAVGQAMAGTGRLWLAPFDPPDAPASDPPVPSDLANVCLVVPTSGSTGTPKAVAHTRANLIASHEATAAFLATAHPVAAHLVTGHPAAGHGYWLPLLPPTHIAGIQVLARAHHTAQVLGLRTVPLPDPLPDLRHHFDAEFFLAATEPALAAARTQRLPLFTSLVPTQLTRIITGSSGADARARAALRQFTAILVGGAATDPSVLARARGLRIPIHTTYGASETAGGCVYDARPLPGVTLSVDHTGRAVIDSPTLAAGYVHPDGRLTQDEFTISADGSRHWRTSDLAQIDPDGTLRILGRADDVITTGGKKVAPGDVERAISQSLMLRGMVTDAVVVGVPDPEWGERVEVVVELAPAVDPREATSLVRAALNTMAVPRHMIPRRAHVVSELPRLGIGKIDRSAAARIARAASAPASERAIESPESAPTESPESAPPESLDSRGSESPAGEAAAGHDREQTPKENHGHRA